MIQLALKSICPPQVAKEGRGIHEAVSVSPEVFHLSPVHLRMFSQATRQGIIGE